MISHFDKVIDTSIGIKSGRNKLVIIKTGKGGTIYGYRNKYLVLAHRIIEELGYSVAVLSNPMESICDLGWEIERIRSCGIVFDGIYYVGISDGALIGAQQGYCCLAISRMLLINGPLMINWHKTKKGIEQFSSGEVVMVYGTKDPSYRYYEILRCIENDRVNTSAYDGADHYFSGMEKEFEDVIMKFLST